MDAEGVTADRRIFMHVSDVVPPQNMPEISPLPFASSFSDGVRLAGWPARRANSLSESCDPAGYC